MKNSTLLLLAALALGASAADAQTARHYRMHSVSPLGVERHKAATLYDFLNAKPKNAVRKAVEAAASLPKEQTEYMYMDGEWMEMGTYSFEYDGQGRVTRIDNSDGETVTRTERTWTSLGQLATETESVSEDGGETFVPSAQRVQTYDDILPQLTLTKDKYDWDSETGDWTANYDSFHRTVVRNADRNVTSLTLAVPYMGKFDDTQRITNTFNEQTKQADTFKFEELGYDGTWERKQYLRDLVWHTTNGQLVDAYDSWMSYGNRLESGKISDTDPDTGELVDFGTIHVSYFDDDYVETIDYTDVLSRSVTEYHEVDCGGYDYEYKYYEDQNGDGVLDESDLADRTIERVRRDSYGNETQAAEYALNADTGEMELLSDTRNEYTYDPDNGNAVKEMVAYEYDYDSGDYVPVMKFVTTEFTQIATGIGGVANMSANDNDDAVYTLQGMKTVTGGKGVQIVKRGGRFVKVMK